MPQSMESHTSPSGQVSKGMCNAEMFFVWSYALVISDCQTKLIAITIFVSPKLAIEETSETDDCWFACLWCTIMGMTVIDTMLALRAEVYPGQEIKVISIGEFSLRLADELANNKVDGDIVRTREASNISCLNRRAGKKLSSLRFPNKVCYVSRIFIFISNSSFFFFSFNRDSLFPPSRRLQ